MLSLSTSVKYIIVDNDMLLSNTHDVYRDKFVRHILHEYIKWYIFIPRCN